MKSKLINNVVIYNAYANNMTAKKWEAKVVYNDDNSQLKIADAVTVELEHDTWTFKGATH